MLYEVITGGGGEALGDLWEWDGKRWQARHAAPDAPEPGPRSGHAMTFDPESGCVLLFGGTAADGAGSYNFV